MQTPCPTRIKVAWPWWIVLMLVLALLLLLGFRSPIPKVVFLPLQEPPPKLVQRMVEVAWSWLQFHLPGRRHSVLIRGKILEFKDSPKAADLHLGEVNATTNWVRVWVLNQEQLQLFNETLRGTTNAEVISQPGIQTLSGMRGSMAVGSTIAVNGKSAFAGLEINSLPKVRKDYVDLTSSLQFTEPITNQANIISLKTNIALRSRIQIPKAGGVFVLSDETNGKAIAALLSATVQ